MSTYVTMFWSVSANFSKLLLLYSQLIVAFSFAFFLTLKRPQENDYFESVDKSLLKTVVMSLTGEIIIN